VILTNSNGVATKKVDIPDKDPHKKIYCKGKTLFEVSFKKV
jgi:hypothetical protein